MNIYTVNEQKSQLNFGLRDTRSAACSIMPWHGFSPDSRGCSAAFSKSQSIEPKLRTNRVLELGSSYHIFLS
jgi:hypothetical protein